eukprot:9742155-Alexandrium_andersonii.AAC.1
MWSSAPTRLQRVGVVSCAPPPRPSFGAPAPRPPNKCFRRVPEVPFEGIRVVGSPRVGRRRGAQETATASCKR